MKQNKLLFFIKKYFAQKTIRKLLAECGMWKRNNNYYMMSKTLRLIHFLENKYVLGARKFTGEESTSDNYYRQMKWRKFEL